MTYMKKVAAITIGQSPRVDLVPEISKYLSDDIEIVEYGILDPYTYEEAEAILKPNQGDHVLVSRMRDGRQIKMNEHMVYGLVQDCIHKIEKEGINTIFLMCTGKFPQFEHKGLFLEPFSLIHSIVNNITDSQIGIIVPDVSQIPQSIKYWNESGNDIVIRTASPYKNFEKEVEKIALELKEKDIPLIVMDCMGYSSKMKETVKELTEKPVLLPRVIMAKLLEEFA